MVIEDTVDIIIAIIIIINRILSLTTTTFILIIVTIVTDVHKFNISLANAIMNSIVVTIKPEMAYYVITILSIDLL